MNSVAVIVVLAVALLSVLLGVILYWLRRSLRQFCQRTCRRKRRVHEITAPVRPSGENEIVLAVTQRRENISRTMGLERAGNRVVRHSSNVTELTRTHSRGGHNIRPYRAPPPYLTVTRHQSFPSQDRPGIVTNSSSPLVSNLSSLQSLLMSSQVAVFNSSSERLSLSSQNQVPLQSISSTLHQPVEGRPVIPSLSFPSTTTVRSSSVHLPQPSYFEDPPPSYYQSLLIRKLRASNRSATPKITPSTSNNTTGAPNHLIYNTKANSHRRVDTNLILPSTSAG